VEESMSHTQKVQIKKDLSQSVHHKKLKINSLALVREQTIPSEQPPLVAKLVSTFADRGYRMVSATDPHSCIMDF
jgi:hypothetical protein